jgi:hypothetical protein
LEYREHYHLERPHQSLENLVLPTAKAKLNKKLKKKPTQPDTLESQVFYFARSLILLASFIKKL